MTDINQHPAHEVIARLQKATEELRAAHSTFDLAVTSPQRLLTLAERLCLDDCLATILSFFENRLSPLGDDSVPNDADQLRYAPRPAHLTCDCQDDDGEPRAYMSDVVNLGDRLPMCLTCQSGLYVLAP